MKKVIFSTVGVMLATGVLLAQGHDNLGELIARDKIVLAEMRVGDHVLAAGEYEVVCDREQISFTRTSGDKTTVRVPCKGRLLNTVRNTSEVHVSTSPGGMRTLDKLLLRGSNVEHVFK